MRALGYIEGHAENASAVVLSEVLLEVTPESLRELAAFFTHCSSEMERLGETYDHIHFQDACKAWYPAWPDVIAIRKRG
jgi:hypothetical protein